MDIMQEIENMMEESIKNCLGYPELNILKDKPIANKEMKDFKNGEIVWFMMKNDKIALKAKLIEKDYAYGKCQILLCDFGSRGVCSCKSIAKALKPNYHYAHDDKGNRIVYFDTWEY